MSARFTAETFRWEVEAGSRWAFRLPGVEPVYFDGDRIRTRNWLDTKHAGGAMHEPRFSFTLARLIELLDPRTYVDIGGYVGYFTILPLAWLAPTARVFCFEVNRRFCLLIRHSVDLNTHLSTSRVFVQNAGIGESVKLATDVFLEGFELRDSGPEGETNAHVDLLTLDHLYDTMSITPDLIKMDIEGYEAPAFRGGQALLRDARPTILFELHSNGFLAPHGATRAGVMQDLENLDYQLFAVLGDRSSPVVDHPLVRIDGANRDAPAAQVNSGIVAIASERASMLDQLCQ